MTTGNTVDEYAADLLEQETWVQRTFSYRQDINGYVQEGLGSFATAGDAAVVVANLPDDAVEYQQGGNSGYRLKRDLDTIAIYETACSRLKAELSEQPLEVRDAVAAAAAASGENEEVTWFLQKQA